MDFDREKKWWDEKAPHEEEDRRDEPVNRALRWREIERHLEGVETILDIGAGTGVFSIPLAKRGFRVTHLDLSPAMVEIARSKSKGIEGITFSEGNVTNLSQFGNRSFDLALNMDGAISFSGPEAEKAIIESCRVTRKKLILTVSNKGWMVPVWLCSSISAGGNFMKALSSMMERGEWQQDEHPDNPLLSKGLTQDYLGTFKAFLPGEISRVLEKNSMKVLRCTGLGSLAGLCDKEVIEEVQKNENLLEEFLNLCERFDLEIMPGGPGTRQRAGLIAVGEIEKL